MKVTKTQDSLSVSFEEDNKYTLISNENGSDIITIYQTTEWGDSQEVKINKETLFNVLDRIEMERLSEE